MKRTILTMSMILLIAAAFLAAQPPREADVRKALVRIETVSQKPSYNDPWRMESERSGSGSGCIIAGRRVLTSAHVIGDAKYIQVQRSGDTEKYTARVEFVAHDCDLALLSVDDPEFFEDVLPLELGRLPLEGDQVVAYGFPTGGNKLSLTGGVVSRIELRTYMHSLSKLLALQIDAAINPGNSGGPVLKDGRLVGVAFQSATRAENMGFAVPGPVIERFLKDVQDGSYDGFPALKLDYQEIRNPAKRAALQLKDRRRGVYVTHVEYGSSLFGVLRPGDVLLSLAGEPIGNDGSIEFRDQERVEFGHILSRHQVGDLVELSFLRHGREQEAEIELRIDRGLVELPAFDRRPSYFIFAGLLFMPVSWDYMLTWRRNEAPIDIQYLARNGRVSPEKSQAVMLTKVLPHEINRGYHDLTDEIITRVNGRLIGSIADLPAAFAALEGEFHLLELAGGEMIVLRAAEVAAAQAEILEEYGIGAGSSEDLR